MTYEEARNRLLKSVMPTTEEEREYDMCVLEALEKQIPYQPQKYYITHKGVHLAEIYSCICDAMVCKGDHHCFCGQLLDWSAND